MSLAIVLNEYSGRARYVRAGLAGAAVCVVGATVIGPAWLLWRVLDAPPADPEPAEYADYRVTVTDRCLLIRQLSSRRFNPSPAIARGATFPMPPFLYG